MIGLNSITIDVQGDVVVETLSSSNLHNSTRRVSRTKTLDGGCVIVDGGFSDSDRTLEVVIKYSLAAYTIIKHLHKDETLIYISTDSNFYSGVISALNLNHDQLETIKFTILTKEKLNE